MSPTGPRTSLPARMNSLHPSVRKLGWVSFLNDSASEMIYPMLPAFLAAMGATPMALGVLEGFAEAAASAVKVVSGRLSDRRGRKKPLIVAGYLVSNAARPLMSLAAGPVLVIVLRVIDRLGKGLRTAPRDAVIAAVTPEKDRGHAFGFHQGMDHWGAVAGPVLGSGLLLLPWFDPRRVFLFALAPGLLCVGLTLLLSDPDHDPTVPKATPSPTTKRLSPAFWRFLAVQSVFSLAASSDTFLLLRAEDLGVPLSLVALLWAFHNALRALFSKWGGGRSDRVGRRRSLATGWLVYAGTYVGFALADGPSIVVLLFFFYAGYFVLTDGAEKALVADFADASHRGLAFGVTQAVTGGLLLVANLLMGFVWTKISPEAGLLMSAGLSALAALLLQTMVAETVGSPHHRESV